MRCKAGTGGEAQESRVRVAGCKSRAGCRIMGIDTGVSESDEAGLDRSR
jgi:hypothetical protein